MTNRNLVSHIYFRVCLQSACCKNSNVIGIKSNNSIQIANEYFDIIHKNLLSLLFDCVSFFDTKIDINR